MTRLIIHVEGETEETFVNELLAPHLYGIGFHAVSAKLLGNARNRSHRGGIRSWPIVREDIVDHLRGDDGCFATTLVDYYALPSGGPNGWPDRHLAPAQPLAHRARIVESAMEAAVNANFAHSGTPSRFVGGVLLHEFEALLFSNCAAFAQGIGSPEVAPALQAIRDGFPGPECINDNPATCPSRRVLGIIPGYQKPIHGNVGALEVGLAAIRAECPHFDDWLGRVESLMHC